MINWSAHSIISTLLLILASGQTAYSQQSYGQSLNTTGTANAASAGNQYQQRGAPKSGNQNAPVQTASAGLNRSANSASHGRQLPANAASQQNSVGVPPQPATQNQNPEIPWLRSATEAAMQSQSTGKPILVYVRSKNCYYCDLLQKNTWQDQATRAKVMHEMIPLKLTLEENKEAVEAMKVKSFPSVIIFSPRREYLARIDGYVTPEQFQSQVSKAMLANQPVNSNPVKR